MTQSPDETRRLTYAVRQYMSHLDLTEFLQRAADIYTNLSYETPSSVLLEPPPGGWRDLWDDVEDEALRRFGDGSHLRLRAMVQALVANRLAVVRRVPWFDAVYQDAKATVSFLVRYGKRKYLEPAFRQGRIRIHPASFYADPSLNPAVKDDELKLGIQPHPDEYRMEVIDRDTRLPKGRVEPINNMITFHAHGDYFVYCMSDYLSEFLLDEFEADACLLIFEPTRFFERVCSGLHKQFPSPPWGWDVVTVVYLDPINLGVRRLYVHKAKHFRFAYQQERRLIWATETPVQGLRAVDLELGSLEDCCRLYPS